MKKVLSVVVAFLIMFAAVGCNAKVASITLDTGTLTLEAGSSQTLKASVVNTEEKVTWSSDKIAIATVDSSGKVTAVAAGTAKITAKAGDVEAVCTVTVKAAAVITLSSTAANLEIGATKQITATVTGSSLAQVWSSSDPAVATVSDAGLITAVSAGSATVTVKVGNAEATVAVKVFAAPAITFDRATETAVVGIPLTLDPAISREDYTVLWSSSDEAIATVNDAGVVTGKAVGSATITAAFEEAPTVSATCIVTVKFADKITLNTNRITLKAVNEEFQIVGTINNGITDPIVWSSSDSETISVSAEGLIKAVKLGTATITATAVGVTATCDVTVQDFTSYTKITTVREFMAMAKNMEDGTKYVLMNDLDFTGRPIQQGFGWNNGAHIDFNAVFDGNGYALKNLSIGNPASTGDDNYNTALFCQVGWKGVVRNVTIDNARAGLGGHTGIIADLNYGTIENINFINCEVKNLQPWNARTGGVVGKNMPNAKIRNISGKIIATGKITGVENGCGGGAIAGANDGVIENCIIETNVQSDTETRYAYLVYKLTDAELAPFNVLRKTAEEQKDVNLYAGWDLGLWNIDGTAAPTLKNAGAEAPLIVEMDETAKIYTGYSLKLLADVNKPGKTIVWTTSDATVATVVNGTVTAVGVGECDITATVETASATCKVTIAKAPIRLDKKMINLATDATEKLTYELADSDAIITWKTSDENVALVDAAGTVTGVGFGSANITATVSDLTVTCVVNSGTVALQQDFATVTELGSDWVKTITGATSTVTIKDGALKLNANYAGQNAAIMFPTNDIIGTNTRYVVDMNFSFDAFQNTSRYIGIRFAQTGADAFVQFAIRVNAKSDNSGIEMAQWNKVASACPNPPKGYAATSNYITQYSKAAPADLKIGENVNVKFIIDGQNFTLYLNGTKIGLFRRAWAQDQTQPWMSDKPILDTYTTKNIQIFADQSNISVKDITVMVDPNSTPEPAPAV